MSDKRRAIFYLIILIGGALSFLVLITLLITYFLGIYSPSLLLIVPLVIVLVYSSCYIGITKDVSEENAIEQGS